MEKPVKFEFGSLTIVFNRFSYNKPCNCEET